MSDAVSADHIPMSGQIPVAAGAASMVRIPVPGTQGLAIEFSPRGRVPASGSTSTLFVQDVSGRRHLRLDYGYNVRTKSINYHWNQQGTAQSFGIQNHQIVGSSGEVAYHAAKYFKWAGRIFVIAGAAVDIYSVAVADKPIKRATEVASAWALAWVGCRSVGAGAAWAGSAYFGVGSIPAGIGGCVVGGIGGYWVGERTGSVVYEWTENTIFRRVPEVSRP
jgi:hypothetical protein